MSENIIQSEEDLRDHMGYPEGRAAIKEMPRLDRHARHFISLCPFLVIATATETGADASPKGDPPGFVQVLDDTTLLIPDRIGNNRVDTFRNLLVNPHVGIFFLVPGMNETLRVNGRACITTDDALLASCAVNGRAPKQGLLVEIDEVYMHCAKAMIRSKLWDPSRHIDRKSFPSIGEIYADQLGGDLDPSEIDRQVTEKHREQLY